jgi:O-antigen/teichoic acid export membrane protein
MGIVFRQSIKTSLVTFAGALLGAAIVYLSTHILSTQQYGFSRNLVTQSIVAIQLILMGTHSMLIVYIHKYPAGDERRKLLLTSCLIIPVLLSVLLTVPYLIFRTEIIHLFYKPEDRWLAGKYFYLLPFSAFLWSFMTLLEQYLSSQMKVAASAFTREVVHRVVQIALLLLYARGYISFDLFFITTIGSVIVPVVLLLWMSARSEGFGISFDLTVFNQAEYIEMLRFSVYHLLTNFSISLLGYIDALMLAPLDKSGTSAVAVYTPAVFLMSILQIPYRAMATAAMPALAVAYERKETDKLNSLFRRSAINGWIVAVGMMAIIICNLPNVTRVLKPEYNTVAKVALILLLGRMVDMLTGLNNEVLSISSHYRFLFWMTIGLLAMIIGFNWWLIPIYGVTGAALGTSSALSVFNIMKLIVVKRRLGLQPISMHTFTVLLVGLIALLAGYILPLFSNAVVDAILRTGIVFIVFAALLLIIKPSKDLQDFIHQMRTAKRLF